MPTPAPDTPPREPLAGTVRLHRVYRDVLGRPMTGTVTLVPSRGYVDGETTVVAAPVTVALDNGELAVDLPPDTYQFTALLRTADNVQIQDRGSVELS